MGFPSKNTEVGCYFLLRGIFPTYVSSVSCIGRWVLYHWETWRSLHTYPMEGHTQRWVRGLSRDQVSNWKADFGRGLKVHSQPSDPGTKVKATPARLFEADPVAGSLGTVRFSFLLCLALRFQFFFRLSLEPDSESGDPRKPICWTCATELKYGLRASVCWEQTDWWKAGYRSGSQPLPTSYCTHPGKILEGFPKAGTSSMTFFTLLEKKTWEAKGYFSRHIIQ